MKVKSALSLAVTVGLALSGSAAKAQAVHVTNDHGTVTLSVNAQKPYTLTMSGQPKMSTLNIGCQQKGKKSSHAIVFSPGTIVKELEYSSFGSSAALALDVTLNNQRLSTNWIAYGNVENFAYYGKTEPDRVNFLQALLGGSVLSMQFTPFLTGELITATFDLSGLRGEFDKHPECAIR